MRNLLEEFHAKHGFHPPTILGVREHVFTGRFIISLSFSRTHIHTPSVDCRVIEFYVSPLHLNALYFSMPSCSVSSLASFMSNQETSFVTLGQRVLAFLK